MKKALYYVKKFSYNSLPSFYFKWKYEQLKKKKNETDPAILENRISFYCRKNQPFKLPPEAKMVKEITYQKPSPYYFDLKEFLHFFTPETRFAYFFGDNTHINSYPTIFKARPIYAKNENSVLFKLNKIRHYQWVQDPFQFEEKKNALVWRGDAHQKIRQHLLINYQNKSRFDVGDTSSRIAHVKWRKEFMSKQEQLRFKFIFCPEGRDVATNLKWVFSSNSLCMMPKPTIESWFMESSLKAGIHYVEVKNDLSDLEDKMDYYSLHTDEAKEIVKNAQNHAQQFMDNDLEDLLCLEVLNKYVQLSNQEHALRFED